MPEPYQWQSALATLGIEAHALSPMADAGVVMSERRAGTQLAIRGDGSNDDIVARQLREAAIAEDDPELREKLWEEYRRYKASLGGSNKDGKS